MATGSVGKHQYVAAWVCILVACSGGSLSVNGKKLPPSMLVLYEHEDRVAPRATEVTSATPSGNLSTVEFGTVIVVANVLRDGLSNDWTRVGKAVGVVTIEDDFSLSLARTLVLNTSSYSGSLATLGYLDVYGNGEVAITGGTGDFRWARGYVEVFSLPVLSQYDAVYKHSIYLKYGC